MTIKRLLKYIESENTLCSSFCCYFSIVIDHEDLLLFLVISAVSLASRDLLS